MNKAETGQLLDRIANYYPGFRAQVADSMSVLNDWHKILSDTSLSDAIERLEQYASKPENKYAPHPGALKKVKTDQDRYHEEIRQAGDTTLKELEEMRKTAVAPTEEQRRRVREYLGRVD